ncbi:hypothetical protein CYMTET_47234 [Cymbomonas tetramitiformis]|uniref:Uncharacterized protein n=1 Tax=Cymbomonas tetramitiformis TaxID=36881 RepID=A0AAE0BUN2_9CHLO|nr:hypothetical protein CYMTET_47234 [Cymbomonas tetramitiformis]
MRHADMVKKRRSTVIFKTNALEILKILADTERKAPIKRRSLQALVIAPDRGEGESIPFMDVDQPELSSLLKSEMDWLDKEGHNFELENEACGDPFSGAVSADKTCALEELVSAIIKNWSTLLNGFLKSQAAPDIIETYQHVLTTVAIKYRTTIHQIVTIDHILRLISRTIDRYNTRDMFTLYGKPLISWYASTSERRMVITNRLREDVEKLDTKLGKPYDPSSTSSTKEHDKLKEKKALAEKRMRFVSDAYPNDDSTPPTIW